MSPLVTRAVALWLAQSLLAAGAALTWLAAARRAKRAGAPWPLRWLFPWAGAWRAGGAWMTAVALSLAGLYAACWWLARRA